MISTIDRNVCKTLNGHVVLYAVFVDTKYTQPWSAHDITSTLDSIHRAEHWLEHQAEMAGIHLDVEVKCFQKDHKVPLILNLPGKTLSGTLFPLPYGIRKLDKWTNDLSKRVSSTLPKDTSRIVSTRNNNRDRERLIAKLRDLYKTDNVALMFFVNNYFTEELSVSLYTGVDYATEYSVVSFKKPGVIAHEFLHLFGALDLYVSPFDKKRKAQKQKEWAMKEFPDEIMAFADRNIDSLGISPFTQYMIGWRGSVDQKYVRMILGKKIKLIKY